MPTTNSSLRIFILLKLRLIGIGEDYTTPTDGVDEVLISGVLGGICGGILPMFTGSGQRGYSAVEVLSGGYAAFSG
jgi:hypothetical protein